MSRIVGLAVLAGCAAAGPVITLEGGCFRVTGADGVFEVYVAGAVEPLFGVQRIEGGDLVFEPRFPLKAGLAYRAVFRSGSIKTERTFSVAALPPGPPTIVRHVYPSRDVLPENLLKFYLHFSAPMSRGEAYRRIHLLDASGRRIDLPFLELNEELWDRAATRLTLFFDPGRIKRGLLPRELMGPVLEAGKSYTLVIDRDWQDAAGHPLKEDYRRTFKAAAPDDAQPDPGKWTLHPPRAGTKEPLTVLFGESLDEAMLGRVLAVHDGEGKPVAGRIEIDREETHWRFHADAAWRAGKHALVVDAALEDLAGNSVGRPFEVDVVRPVEGRISSKTVSLPFECADVLFSEGFDDALLLQRGWYDGDKFIISAKEPYAGKGCVEYSWKAAGTTPAGSSGIRHLFEPTETVYLRFYMKLSEGWGWTGRPFHPHLMHFMTTENEKFRGPAASHLTVYIEPWNGHLRLAAQDIQNKDAPHGLTQGPLRGGYNGVMYDSKEILFNDAKWHCVEAMFQLNSLDLKADKPNADGIVRGWFDGKPVIDRTDVVLRSTDFPKMKFNQFLLTPYFGPGLLPHEQTLWIDELAVGTKRPAPVKAR